MTTLNPQIIIDALEPRMGHLPRFDIDIDGLTPLLLRVEFRVPADGSVSDQRLNELVKDWFRVWGEQFRDVLPDHAILQRSNITITHRPGDDFLAHEDQAWDRYEVTWQFGIVVNATGFVGARECVRITNE